MKLVFYLAQLKGTEAEFFIGERIAVHICARMFCYARIIFSNALVVTLK
jgi:hypothetical protein